MNQQLLELILQEKRQEMLQEAKRQHLVTLYNTANPGLRAQLQLAFGDFLIRLGEKLKRRYIQVIDLDEKFCRD